MQFHTGVQAQVLGTLLPVHLPSAIPRRTEEDGLSTGITTTHMQDLDGGPDFWTLPGLALAVEAT